MSLTRTVDDAFLYEQMLKNLKIVLDSEFCNDSHSTKNVANTLQTAYSVRCTMRVVTLADYPIGPIV